jgi:enamine deaminase RidA (YjgF/YER057c/UK114 family)
MNIDRMETGKRMSQIVIHDDTIYLAGQVAENGNANVGEQTQSTLDQIDALLATAGSDKSKILSATIYLPNMTDFAAMNTIWDAWVAPGKAPARACVEARLASPDLRVEISIVAAR